MHADTDILPVKCWLDGPDVTEFAIAIGLH